MRFGNSRTFKEGEKLHIPADWPPVQIMVKSAGPGAARLLVTRDDGQQPYFVWCPQLRAQTLTLTRPVA